MKERCSKTVLVCTQLKLTALSTATALAFGAGSVSAMEIDVGNPDFKLRWDNTVRYNAGVRTQKADSALSNTRGLSNSTLKFDRGDLITNRFDLFSEMDVVYKDDQGFRISAQAWYDNAYNSDKEQTNPALGSAGTAYPNQRYTGYTKRWNEGPSAEFLDAFVFKKFYLGDVENNVKLGSHNLYWGESLYTFIHGVSYSQGPVDIRKASATPGIEAKELFKPLNQVSFSSQVSDTLTFAGQYFLDWKASPFPDGGTYWGGSDFLSMGSGTRVGGANGILWDGRLHEPDDKHGDWGLMSRWSPEWLGGTLGFYYREYTDKFGLIAASPNFDRIGFDYLDKRATLVGMSLSKSFGGLSFGAEISHRKNTGLSMGGATTLGTEPVGDTWHGLVNVLGYMGSTPLFDSMNWNAELTYSRLDKVRRNDQNFNSKDYGCKGNNLDLNCATKDAVGISMSATPLWYQVVDGVDLTMPMFYTTGLKGNSPVMLGGSKGMGSYSVGLNAEYLNKYVFSLAYNGYFSKKTKGIDPVTGLNTVVDYGGSTYWDRDNVTFTFKTTF